MAGAVEDGDDLFEFGDGVTSDLVAVERLLLLLLLERKLPDQMLHRADAGGGCLLDGDLAVHIGISHQIDGHRTPADQTSITRETEEDGMFYKEGD